ncbi:hypothetical protein C8Q77DRAFT_1057596 [Trametes polyzona]|nr:hypothetical protein C8Q77DRAFT_1057596 [Trametes polyzona]
MDVNVPTGQLYEEVLKFVDMLAHNARLDNPLPEGTDFTAEEMQALQEQINALTVFPAEKKDWFFLALSARHLPALASAVRTTSRETQQIALSSYIQLLSLLTDPKHNPYLRKFLTSPAAAGLPILVAAAFNDGIRWLRPSGPGHICTFIMHTLQWCDAALGDDGRASVDKSVRIALRQKLRALKEQPNFDALDQYQRIEIQRLEGMLGAVEGMPTPPDQPGYFLQTSRDHIEGSIPGLEECNVCMEEDATLQCSRCKSVKYCGKKCQTKDWKGSHRMRCYAMTF